MNTFFNRAGVRTGLHIGALGLANIAISTLTPIPHQNWLLLQNAFSILLVFLCGFAGVQAYPQGKNLSQCALAGLTAGALGTGLYNGMLLLVFAFFRSAVQQFPFANSQDQLMQGVVGSLIILPMTAGFGVLGGMVARSVDAIQGEGGRR